MTNFQQTNYSRLTPCVIVDDVMCSVDFYGKAFGFELLEKHEKDGEVNGATLKLGEVTFMLFSKAVHPGLGPLETKARNGMTLYAYCSDVDALYKNALACGAVSLAEPQDSFWGDRYCQLLDIDGYEWGFATYQS